MIDILDNNYDFFELFSNDPRPIILYGAGNTLMKYYSAFESVEMICDETVKYVSEIDRDVEKPERLSDFKEPVYVIVTVSNDCFFEQICAKVSEYLESGIIVNAKKNRAFIFDFWSTEKSYKPYSGNEKLKVNIVCRDSGWIFKKFADRLFEHLTLNNVDVTISPYVKKDVDINHHIPYVAYMPRMNDTLMITHVDNMRKVRLLQNQLQLAGLGICMSKSTMDMLVSYGISRDKLCYINPAHDGEIKPHRYVIGITHKCHDSEDLRKRATVLVDILSVVDPNYFELQIMGSGWDAIVAELRNKGFVISYYPEFERNKYYEIMQKIDFFLYTGFDEGTMGYLDALTAGAGTIVTPQGYHLDAGCPIDYPCRTISDFRQAFLDLQNKRKKRIDAVKGWTWESYAKKHIDIWMYLTKRAGLKELFVNQSFYEDGIYSMFLDDNRL